MVELIRIIFLCAAGFSLFHLARVALGHDKRMRLIVLAGFLGRAVLSQILFWVSYLSLPFWKSMQSGGGLWFFAEDAKFYTTMARVTASGGIDDIFRLPLYAASVTYIQALSIFTLLFGNPVAVSMLLNLFCYLGACAIVVRWSETAPASRNAALIPLAAISFSPAGVLWSLQPLKDTYFQFLIVAFIGSCFLWQRAWRSERMRMTMLAGVSIVATLFLLSGVRWYFGFFVMLTTLVFLVLVALTMHRRRVLASAAAAVMIVVVSQTYLYAAKPFLPPTVAKVLSFRSPPNKPATHELVERVESARNGFDRAGGNTLIQRRPPVKVAVAKPAAPPPAPVQVAAAPAHTPPRIAAAPPAKAKKKKKKAETPAPAPPPVATATAPPVAAKPITPAPITPAPAAPAPVAPKPAAPKPVPPPVQVQTAPPPDTRAEKLLVGLAAAALPRAVVSRLGLFQISGGRNLWWFVELDTLIFDAVLVLALIAMVVNFRRGSYRNAVFWLVLVVTFVNFLAVSYTVTNFGTLFRLRMMVFTGLALLPLALFSVPSKSESSSGAAGSQPAVDEAPAG